MATVQPVPERFFENVSVDAEVHSAGWEKGSAKSLFGWSDPGAERELQEAICSLDALSDLPERTFASQ